MLRDDQPQEVPTSDLVPGDVVLLEAGNVIPADARLVDAMGQAERIKHTVFPASYRLLVYCFIYLFLMTLSLGLVKVIGLWAVGKPSAADHFLVFFPARTHRPLLAGPF